MQASVWALAKLSSCGERCQLIDVTNKAYSSLASEDSGVVQMTVNPQSENLVNIMAPIRVRSLLRVMHSW